MNTVELLSPSGDFETALAAFAAGADAVYCGLADFSARAFAKNLSFEELKKLMRYARANDRKVYVTFNTLLDEDQLEDAVETLAILDDIGPDALIVQDLGIARLCRRHFPGLALHASTQLVAHNLEGVLALKELGFVRVVLARELSLDEIRSIAQRCAGLELEVFIHGALCYSISGLCLFGAMEKGRSGNRGKCPYCCREGTTTSNHNLSDIRYPFSMKDLRLGEDVKKLVDAGVASLKIEGRMKSPLYVASVTRYYRDILDESSWRGAESAPYRKRVTTADLETVFSRRTTELYFNGRRDNSNNSNNPTIQQSNNPTIQQSNNSPIDSESLGHLGAEIGVVKKVTRDREGRAWLRFHTCRGLEKHDGLQFELMTDEGRHVGMGIVEMRQAISRRSVFEVNAGTDVEVLVSDDLEKALKPEMRIFCSMSNAVKRRFPVPGFRDSDWPGTHGIAVTVTIAKDKVTAFVQGEKEVVSQSGTFVPAKNPEKTREAVERAFGKLGGTDYRLVALTLNDPDRLFVPTSVMNDVRRDLVEMMDRRRDDMRRATQEAALADDSRVFSVDSVISDPKSPKSPKDSKDPKSPKSPKDPKDSKSPKSPKSPKDPKEP